MKNLSRHRSVLALALLAGLVLGCKSTTTSTSSNSNSNAKEEPSKNSNAAYSDHIELN